MLLKMAELEAVKAGAVSVVFRRWRRPTVKAGGTLKTAIGVLAIEEVEKIRKADITEKDALGAGHGSKASLLAALAKRDGSYYRIRVRFAGADPRIALRERDDLSESEHDKLGQRLYRLDNASKSGAWTHEVLRMIRRHPHVVARELAEAMGRERYWLKANVRKLKNLGLTISHEVGYELSPRGRAVLRRLDRDASGS